MRGVATGKVVKKKAAKPVMKRARGGDNVLTALAASTSHAQSPEDIVISRLECVMC